MYQNFSAKKQKPFYMGYVKISEAGCREAFSPVRKV